MSADLRGVKVRIRDNERYISWTWAACPSPTNIPFIDWGITGFCIAFTTIYIQCANKKTLQYFFTRTFITQQCLYVFLQKWL